MLREEVIANRGYVVFPVGENDRTDEVAVRVLKQDCPDFLLPFTTISMDGKAEFRYELTDGIRMSYQRPQMTRREFVRQMAGMLAPLKSCSDWMLDYHCFCFDRQYIFINGKDQTVRYIYLPVGSAAVTDKEIKDFFISIALGAELQDDRDFILKLVRLLQDSQTGLFTVLEFLRTEMEASEPAARSVRTAGGAADGGRVPEITREPARPKADWPGGAASAGRNPGNPAAQEPVPAVRENPPAAAKETPANPAGQNAGKPSSGQFGRSNLEEELMRNLYGEDVSEPKNSRKKKEKEKIRSR